MRGGQSIWWRRNGGKVTRAVFGTRLRQHSEENGFEDTDQVLAGIKS